MKPLSKLLILAAAVVAAFSPFAKAQLVTYETQTGYTGSSLTFSTFGGTMGQTFSNVSAVASMTYNFFSGTGNGGVSSATALTATFGEWTGSSFVGGTTINFGTINVPASTDPLWDSTLSITGASYKNFSYTFDLTSVSSSLINATYGYLTDSSKTYALLLVDQTGSTNLALGGNFANNFTYGAAYPLGGSSDAVFSQIVVAPGSQQLVPVPEASTVAAIIGGSFAAALVGLRLRQRKQMIAAPLAA